MGRKTCDGPTPANAYRERLRNRIKRSGMEEFTPHEIVELLLTFSTVPRREPKKMANALLARFASLRAMLDAPFQELQEIDGMDRGAAAFFCLVRKIAKLYAEQKIFFEKYTGDNWRPALQELWLTRLAGERMECLEIAYLDGNLSLLPEGVERIATGTATHVVPLPKQIIERVMQRNCFAIVLCHNHPNGSELPSEHDERMTRALGHCLRLIEVSLLDHWIVADGKIFSIGERRRL
ncbi:MAG: hypothetical protein LBP65_02515 [Puniceicoccales bacterium]|jgi:DNA repair protein RadC|nr:hypothetical protein [Puniceicoccales bacterium]